MFFDWGVGLETELNQRIDLRVSMIEWTASDNSQSQTLTEIHKSILSPKTSMSFLLICSLLRFSKSVDSPGNAFFQLKFQMLMPLIPKS